jgi:hypothetical protein
MECLIAEGSRQAVTDGLDQLETHVQSRLASRVRHLHLLRRYGGLVLQGHAITYYAKQLAQHAVMAATQLPILANEIEVS